MIGQRFRRIEELLGAAIDTSLNEEALERFVRGAIAEASDLDFKRDPYRKSEDQKLELAKDVSALANYTGGVLVIGVATAKDVASQLSPFEEVTDQHVRELRAWVASYVHPLPRMEVLQISSVAQPGKGYLLILVPRSPRAPHAVSASSDRGLTYWTRYGSQTVALSETEVAARYQDRFERGRAESSRLGEVMADGLERLESAHSPWLALALVPRDAGQISLTLGSTLALEAWLKGSATEGLFRHRLFTGRVGVGLRRILVMGSWNAQSRTAHDTYSELHADGAGFAAIELHGQDDDTEQPLKVSDEAVVEATASSIRLLASFAVDHAGALGEALLEVRLVRQRHRGQLEPTRPMTLMVTRLLPPGLVMEKPLDGILPFDVAPSRTTVDVSAVASSPVEWLLATRSVASDILQGFGLAEPVQIGPDGTVRLGHVAASRRADVRQWAEELGLPMDEGRVPNF